MRYLLCFACFLFASCDEGGNGCEGAGKLSGSSGCGVGSSTPGNFTLSVRRGVEVEPNNDLSTASVVQMPTRAAPGDLVGFVIEGSVNDASDHADIFSFTSSRSGRILFKLCESFCDTRYETDRYGNSDSLLVWIAYFDVLDADGKILATTVDDNPIENYGDIYIDAGVITYIVVYANDTLHLDQPYRISAVERPGD